MPEYSFICNNCNNTFTIYTSISKYTGECECPFCRSLKVNRDYQEDLPRTSVKKGSDEITVGHLAHRNTENLSSDEKSHLTYKHNKYKYDKPQKDLPDGMSRVGSPNSRKVSKKQRRKDIREKK